MAKKLDKFTQFFRDVNRAYKKGVVCPIAQSFYHHHNQREYGCALTAAYLVNGNEVTSNLENDEGGVVERWAAEHYGFSREDMDEIIEAYDDTSCYDDDENPSEAAKIGIKLREKHEPLCVEDIED